MHGPNYKNSGMYSNKFGIYKVTQKKRELLINPTKIEEIQTCKTFLWRQHAVDRSTDP
jgi:hypothetical protein